jgi:hypothetical protein
MKIENQGECLSISDIPELTAVNSALFRDEVNAALPGAPPLIEIDLADPMSTWRVDPSKPWWRNGHWSGNG